MKMQVLAALACLSLASFPVEADDCRRESAGLKDSREGEHHAALVQFKYESRVQEYASALRKYTWCLENISRYQVAEFRWGSERTPHKYFSNIVVPGRMNAHIRTDASAILTDLRIIRFRALNRGDWDQIKVETLSNENLGQLTALQYAQATQSIVTDAAAVNFDKMTAEELGQYIKKVGKIELLSRTTATVPANERTQMEIHKNEYAEYQQDDFVHLDIQITNTIFESSDGIFSALAVWVRPGADDTHQSIAAALKEAPVRLRFEENNLLAKWFRPRVVVNALHSQRSFVELGLVRADQFEFLDVALRIEAEKLETVYAILPAQILVPVN